MRTSSNKTRPPKNHITQNTTMTDPNFKTNNSLNEKNEMYQAIYECRLCKEMIKENIIFKIRNLKYIDFVKGIVIDEELNFSNFSLLNSHNCKDGSFGFMDFKGIKKIDS